MTSDVEVHSVTVAINNDFHIEKPLLKQDIKLDFSLSDGSPFLLVNSKLQ